MQKRVTIITLVLMSLLFVGVSLSIFFVLNSSYQKKAAELNSQIQTSQAELNRLQSEKDVNGFTPTEVVKEFFNEVKSDSNEKAKLYLGPDVQDMDIAASLKLGNDYSNIVTGDSFENTDGDNVDVNMTFVLATDDATVRTFALTKYDEAWKITGVTAE